MKLGISTASFFNRAPTENCFDILRQLKCEYAEVFLNSFYEYEKPFVDALAGRRGTLNVFSVHALPTQFEPELYSPSLRVRNDAELVYRKICYAGHILGAKYYTFHGPLKLKNQPYNFNFAKLGERTNQLIEIAETYGLKLSYENVHYSYFSEPSFFRSLSKYCPKLYMTLDIKHALLAGQDVFDYVAAAGDKLSHIHACDILKNNSTALPGQGRINYERLFRLFVSGGLNCPVLMEVYTSDYSEMKELATSFEYLNNCMRKATKA